MFPLPTITFSDGIGTRLNAYNIWINHILHCKIIKSNLLFIIVKIKRRSHSFRLPLSKVTAK